MGKLLPLTSRAELQEFGISRQLLSDWQHARKLPTLTQLYVIAALTGASRYDLADQLAMRRATDDQRRLLESKYGLDGLAARTREGFAFPARGSPSSGSFE